jgi:hypothetical protein
VTLVKIRDPAMRTVTSTASAGCIGVNLMGSHSRPVPPGIQHLEFDRFFCDATISFAFRSGQNMCGRHPVFSTVDIDIDIVPVPYFDSMRKVLVSVLNVGCAAIPSVYADKDVRASEETFESIRQAVIAKATK